MSGRSNEIQASVNSEIDLLLSLRLLLLSHVHLVLIVHELDDGSPAVEGKRERGDWRGRGRGGRCELRCFGFARAREVGQGLSLEASLWVIKRARWGSRSKREL